MAAREEHRADPALWTVAKTLMLQNYEKRQLAYLPAEHRNAAKGTNYFETLVHMLKASIGTGILAMPHAFSKVGYVVGIIGTIMIGLLCTYCQKTLVAVQYELCRRNEKPSMSYSETAHSAIQEGPQCCRNFKFMSVISNIFILCFQLGCSCIYMIFVSTNVMKLMTHYLEYEQFLIIYMLITTVILIFVAMIHNLKFLAYLSLTANIATTTSFLILAFYIVTGNLSFENRTKVGHMYNLPLFIGTVLFSLEAIGTMIPLENNMKNPLDFTKLFGVLHCAMIPTITLYFLVGLFGYLNYGTDIKGSITLNLPKDEWPAIICMICFIFAIFSTNVLCVFITYEILWKSYVEKPGSEELSYGPAVMWLCQYLVRVSVIILTLLFALLIPNLELFISLTGSLCLASAGLALPAIFNLYTYWNDYKGCSFTIFLMWCSLIIIFGVLACFIGVVVSFEHIYLDLWRDFFKWTLSPS